MSEPTVGVTTSRWFDSLPEFYRVADARAGWVLLRFLSLLGDQASDVAVLADRVDYLTPSEGGTAASKSALVDPDTADVAWLPWLGQLVGVRLAPAMSEAAKRAAIRTASIGWQGGTKDAVAAAARTALTGTQYVRVVDHSTDTGAGGQWDVLLITRATETPDVSAVLDAVVTARAKPAGVVLWHKAYSSSVGQQETAWPTVGARSGLSLTTLAEAGL